MAVSLIVMLALFASHPVLGQQTIVQAEIVQDTDGPAPEVKRATPLVQSKQKASKPINGASAGKTSQPNVNSPVEGQAVDLLESPSERSELAKRPTESQQQMLDEIQSIRKRMGGGIAEQLKDLNLDQEATVGNQEEFERELMRLNTQRLPRPDNANHLPNGLEPNRLDPVVELEQELRALEYQHEMARRQVDSFSPDPARPVADLPRTAGQPTYNDESRIQGVNYSDGQRQQSEKERESFLLRMREEAFGQQARLQEQQRAIQEEQRMLRMAQQRAQQAAQWSDNRPQRSGESPASPELAHRQADILREAARRLEQLAAEFEETNLYDEADETRERARHFWQKSRQLKR